MYERDFVLRHIKLFFELVTKALGLYQKKDIARAEQTIDLAFRQFLGYPFEFLERMTTAGLVSLVSADKERQGERLLIAAELFRCEALIVQEKGNLERARNLCRRSASLFAAGTEFAGPSILTDFRESLERLTQSLQSMGIQVAEFKAIEFLRHGKGWNDAPRRQKGLDDAPP